MKDLKDEKKYHSFNQIQRYLKINLHIGRYDTKKEKNGKPNDYLHSFFCGNQVQNTAPFNGSKHGVKAINVDRLTVKKKFTKLLLSSSEICMFGCQHKHNTIYGNQQQLYCDNL